MLKKIMICAVSLVYAIAANVVLSEMEYPQDLKKAVGPYPNSKILQTVNDSGTVMVIMEVADKPDQVFEFYKKELSGNGWRIVSGVQQEGHNTLISEKVSHNLVVDIGVDQSGNSMISLTLAPK